MSTFKQTLLVEQAKQFYFMHWPELQAFCWARPNTLILLVADIVDKQVVPVKGFNIHIEWIGGLTPADEEMEKYAVPTKDVQELVDSGLAKDEKDAIEKIASGEADKLVKQAGTKTGRLSAKNPNKSNCEGAQ